MRSLVVGTKLAGWNLWFNITLSLYVLHADTLQYKRTLRYLNILTYV